ncbi:hypothetical protein NCCP2716_26290 [Sporosarcina sp. NCCP-2716]|nr:hypothetical protein NCCP2716_26290 [Sporosarcina sp. NCCP-2716]
MKIAITVIIMLIGVLMISLTITSFGEQGNLYMHIIGRVLLLGGIVYGLFFSFKNAKKE